MEDSSAFEELSVDVGDVVDVVDAVVVDAVVVDVVVVDLVVVDLVAGGSDGALSERETRATSTAATDFALIA